MAPTFSKIQPFKILKMAEISKMIYWNTWHWFLQTWGMFGFRIWVSEKILKIGTFLNPPSHSCLKMAEFMSKNGWFWLNFNQFHIICMLYIKKWEIWHRLFERQEAQFSWWFMYNCKQLQISHFLIYNMHMIWNWLKFSQNQQFFDINSAIFR